MLEVQKSPGCDTGTAQPQNSPGHCRVGGSGQHRQREPGRARSIHTQLLLSIYSRF